MGRRPNPIILQFFERGAKLDDSSNRYQHTCKSCGEKFPKGRVDNLTAHLLKKCPAISSEDRQYALDKLSEPSSHNGHPNSFALAVRAEQERLPPNEHQTGHSMSALETLAEVSRQHLDTSGNTLEIPSHQRKRRRGISSSDLGLTFGNAINVEQRTSVKIADMPLEDRRSNHDDSALLHHLEQLNQSFLQESTNEIAQTATERLRANLSNVETSDLDLAVPSTSSEILELGHVAEHSVQQLQNDNVYSYDIDPSLQPAHDSLSTPGATYQGPPVQSTHLHKSLDAHSSNQAQRPHAAFLNDFSIASDATRSKPRKRFSDVRREEVRGIRKQGACIRCRMLKKPCSDGTPCNTCAKLVSSRLWKQPCVRTRLGEDFDFFSAGVHNIIFFHENNSIKNTTEALPSPYRFEASHFLDGKCTPVQFRGVKRIFVNPTLSTLGIDAVFTPDTDADDVDEFERYIRQSSHAFVEHEPSHNIRESLRLAQTLISSKADVMLERALILWTATQILIDPQAEWKLFLSPDSGTDAPSQSSPNRFQLEPNGQWASSYSHTLSYLRTKVERVCAMNARNLVNELERRLLMRSQSSSFQFETFLASFILLNCLERVCWLFQSWAEAAISPMGLSIQPKPSGLLEGHSMSKQTTDRGAWHVERSPREFVLKGQSFSGTLTMLLRVRQIPPQTRVDDNGILRTTSFYEDDVLTAIDSMGQEHRLEQRQIDGQTKDTWSALNVRTTFGLDKAATTGSASNSISAAVMATSWLDRMAVSLDAVSAQQDAAGQQHHWNAHDCRCWELAFCGQLLLPANS